MTDKQPNQYVRLLQLHEIPEVLHDTHVNVLGHACQDATIAEVSCKTTWCKQCNSSMMHCHSNGLLQVKKHYCGLPIHEAVAEFIRQCDNCAQRQAVNTRAPLKPIKCTIFWGRVQADLIDMRASEQDGYHWIFTLKEHFTWYVVLFALRNKEAETVKEKVLLPATSRFNATRTPDDS